MSSTLNEKIGQLIRSARTEAGITQEELAELIGCNQEYISKLERGKQNPSVNKLDEIAKALKKNIGIFFN